MLLPVEIVFDQQFYQLQLVTHLLKPKNSCKATFQAIIFNLA